MLDISLCVSKYECIVSFNNYTSQCDFLSFYCTINCLEQSLHHLLGHRTLFGLFIPTTNISEQLLYLAGDKFHHSCNIYLSIKSFNSCHLMFHSWLDSFKFHCSWLFVKFGTLEDEKSPSKPDEKPTQDDTELDNNEGIHCKNQFIRTITL